jgi:acyl-CoA hydrolase
MTEIVLPQHTNAIGTAFGGAVLGWVDICGAIAAHRHSGRVAVTAAIDDLQFLAPLRVGDVVVLSARVNAAFRSSVEVQVRVEREDPSSRDRTLCLDAFLTFVNLGDDGRPAPVPRLLCATADDTQRKVDAEQRRARRLARKGGG